MRKVMKGIEDAAHNILNFLYFHDAVRALTIEPEEFEHYEEISKAITSQISELGISGTEAEVLRHYVSCALEIALNYDPESNEFDFAFLKAMDEYLPLEKICQDRIHFIQGSLIELCKMAESNGVKYEDISSVTKKLLALDLISGASAAIRFRLSTRLAGVQDPFLGIHFHSYLVDNGILTSGRYKASLRRQSTLELAFLRVGLLMEFEIFRVRVNGCSEHPEALELDGTLSEYQFEFLKNYHDKRLVQEYKLKQGKNDYRFEFPVSKVTDNGALETFLYRVGSLFNHQRFVSGESGKWPNLWGALFVSMVNKHEPGRIIFDAGYSLRIRKEADPSSDTVSNEAKYWLKVLGYTASAKTLRDKHGALIKNGEIGRVVERYNANICKLRNTLPWCCEDTFYHEAVVPGFLARIAPNRYKKIGVAMDRMKISRTSSPIEKKTDC